jgi:hypothetical protein
MKTHAGNSLNPLSGAGDGIAPIAVAQNLITCPAKRPGLDSMNVTNANGNLR